ncbi:hypothetical protein A3C68_00510 [Candidatus Kuenenbacteria bacterium RIFCSPHIGHO2_02_FULL_42_29]|nr:MAG: hypothetical protein A3C68_00510 [Candidatus Kuenenbacteria bacterium RIFCSPHIGHO2_02_FULL_42_29]
MEIPKFSPEETRKKPQAVAREQSFPQKEKVEAGFDSTTALKDEKTLLGKLRGRARKVAEVLILTSALVAGEGIISTARAEEKPPTPITQVEREKQKDLSAQEFIKLSSEQQNTYLQTLAEQPPEHKEVQEMMEEYEVSSKELVTESGMQRIAQFKEQLDALYEKKNDPKQKEKINQAFLTVHRFTLEYGIDSYGKQALTVYNINSDEAMTMNVSGLITRDRNGKPIYDPNETDDFLEDGKQGHLLAAFIEKIKGVSGSELSRIKQIYDLVAYEIPRYKWYHGEGERGKHGYQTFEQLLEKQAGICTEKNALLVYALRQAGFDAYLWGFSGHIYTRIFTAEGALEIDATSSDPFTMSKLATQEEYSFDTNEAFIKGIPQNMQQYAEKWDEGDRYRVFIPLDSEETIEYVAGTNGISVESLRKILAQIRDVKPHPLYEIGRKGKGNITPENSGQYARDLFKKQISYE